MEGGGTQGTYPPAKVPTPCPPARSQWGRGYPKVPTALAKVPTTWPGPDGGKRVPQGTYPPWLRYKPPWPDPDGGRGYPKVPTPLLARSRWGREYPKVPTPQPGPDRGEGGTPRYQTPPQPRYLPPPPPQDRTAYGVLDTPQSVCLLRSCRRTSLLPLVSMRVVSPASSQH